MTDFEMKDEQGTNFIVVQTEEEAEAFINDNPDCNPKVVLPSQKDQDLYLEALHVAYDLIKAGSSVDQAARVAHKKVIKRTRFYWKDPQPQDLRNHKKNQFFADVREISKLYLN
jgi:hypothetical protein